MGKADLLKIAKHPDVGASVRPGDSAGSIRHKIEREILNRHELMQSLQN